MTDTTAAPADSSAAPPTDPVAAFLNTVIAGLTTGVAAPVIETAAETQVPFLALPVVKQLFEYLVGYLAGKISIDEQQGVMSLVFDLQSDAKLAALGQQLLALKNAQASGDPNAISQATQNAVNSWGNLIHFGGIAPVQS